jgi:hypothetical protein
MEIIQYLIIIFVLFAASRVLLQFHTKNIRLGQFLFWEALWTIVLVFGLFPAVFSSLSDFLGVGRIVDVFVYVALGLLFYLMYRIYIKTEELQHSITKLTRHIALDAQEKKKKKKER